MSIARNLFGVRERIAQAATGCGRDPESITLVAVTKTVDVPAIREAVSAGVTDIGENYVQDAGPKLTEIDRNVRRHMIGHLQTNKVRQAVGVFDVIQSVDSLRLGREIGKRCVEAGRRVEILLEVNISGEPSKTGVAPEDARGLCETLSDVPGIELAGLMGIAPFTADADAVRGSFVLLRKIWEELAARNKKWLSMGMTSDFETAIEEGSNMVRIGTAIFGPRQ